MKRFMLCFFLLSLTTLISAQQPGGWKWTAEVRTRVRVVAVDEQTYYLQDIQQSTRRYVAVNLPDELKKSGVTLHIRAMTAEIPPHIKMLGKPAFLLRIEISKRTQKQYRLLQRLWMYRAPK
jgi:hypothetical protein